MPKLPDEPLHRTNINLYERDVEYMKRIYGYGWSEVVRKMVRMYINNNKHVLGDEDGEET